MLWDLGTPGDAGISEAPRRKRKRSIKHEMQLAIARVECPNIHGPPLDASSKNPSPSQSLPKHAFEFHISKHDHQLIHGKTRGQTEVEGINGGVIIDYAISSLS